MFTETDEALTSLEDSMLRICRAQIEAFEQDSEANRPIPMALVQLMTKTHEAILKRMSKRSGMDLNMMLKNPESALLQLDRMKQQIMKVLEQRNQLRVVK